MLEFYLIWISHWTGKFSFDSRSCSFRNRKIPEALTWRTLIVRWRGKMEEEEEEDSRDDVLTKVTNFVDRNLRVIRVK